MAPNPCSYLQWITRFSTEEEARFWWFWLQYWLLIIKFYSLLLWFELFCSDMEITLQKEGNYSVLGSPWWLAAALGYDTAQRDTIAHQGKVGAAGREAGSFGFGSWWLFQWGGDVGRVMLLCALLWALSQGRHECRCGLFKSKLGEGQL